MTYGTLAGVAAYVGHATNESGTFDSSTTPTATQVEAFLAQRSAILDGWLLQAGYGVPATNANALLILAHYANLGAACDVELTQRAGGYDEGDTNKRENKFCAAFMAAQKYIASGALPGADATPPAPFFGLAVGGTTSGGQHLRPMFRRTSFGNVPDDESPANREPDYTGEI